MKNGETVAAFEKAFADYVGARFAIGLCNGTVTLHTALVALGVKPGDRVAVPPLTMASTTIAVLHAGAVPVFWDVHPDTWIVGDWWDAPLKVAVSIPVSLYGLHSDRRGSFAIDDAAQTLRKHGGCAFTSYSFQASKILSLGEGGMLVTNDEGLATKAREFSSLGYRMDATQPRIDSTILKSPDYERHHSLGWNYRMNDVTAAEGLKFMESRGKISDRPEPGGFWYKLGGPNDLKCIRYNCASMYREAINGCEWITPQHVPEGWTHDYWTYAVALESKEFWHPFVEAIERHGSERPYACWRITYQEPAFRHLAPDGTCPVAEDLQPRLVQFQTNDLASAERNAKAVSKAIQELN